MESNQKDQGTTSQGMATMSEDDLLASLGTTRQNTSSYESDVIREATYRLAPTLTLDDVRVGFPDLTSTSLLPFPVQGQAKANRQVVTKVLSKLQAQFRKACQNSDRVVPENPQEMALLAMKQQMLLSMLGTHSQKAAVQKCWNDQEAVEEHYRIQAQASLPAPRKARVPMQQRKQISIPGSSKVAQLKRKAPSSSKKDKKWKDWSDSEDSASSEEDNRTSMLSEMNSNRRRRPSAKPSNNKKNLKTNKAKGALRSKTQYELSSSEQRPERKRSPVTSYAEEEGPSEENELEGDALPVKQEEQHKSNTATTNGNQEDDDERVPGEKNGKDDGMTGITKEETVEEKKDGTATSASEVTCPLCQTTWGVSDSAQIDNELASHMAQCQTTNRRTTRRSRRQRRHPASYNEVDDNDDTDVGERVDPSSKRHSKRRATSSSPPTPETRAKKQTKIQEDDDFVFDDDVDDVSDEEFDDEKNRKYQKSAAKQRERDDMDFVFDDDIIDEEEELQTEAELSNPTAIDDFRLDDYEDRVDYWRLHGVEEMRDMSKLKAESEIDPGAVDLPGGLHIPAWMNDRLFGYQRTGLEWMWQLHRQEAGGCIGDEMGLGKTVQVASFLGAMAASRIIKGVLIIAPATMLRHWLSELAIWAPGLRRILLHSSGDSNSSNFDVPSRNITNQGPGILRNLRKWLKKARRDRVYERIDHPDEDDEERAFFCGTGYVVITTYEHVRRNQDIYIHHPWSYVVMDEAQKIRNPHADITLACKRLRTPHRIAMTGTPIQNDLRELWSLFDFVFPGRLGTLPAFEQEFADPIKRGGYSNASPVQVQLAYRCSLVLRDLIEPYLLRRQKSEVEEMNRMPGKTEHVLFCRLSKRQRIMYEAYLKSDTVSRIFKGSTLLFAAVTMLRKICNHPDLVVSDPSDTALEAFIRNGCVPDYPLDSGEDDDDNYDEDDPIYGEETLAERSGKFEVLAKILPLWKKQGHRVLIFCQWKKMLNIIQRFVQSQGWKFSRLDGNTNVASRQRLVDTFNNDPSYFGMLCTTRTGGVGLNLTGANRIILYDVDWNPQTDAQARERAWRFGQEKEVTVYRLCTAGTIEEKMYQRQIFKTALTNKVLHDPRQRRLFSQKDLHDLLSLQPDNGRAKAGGGTLVDTAHRISKAGNGSKIGGEHSSSSNKAEISTDDGETLRSVLKSKGLAGVFDHNFVDPTGTSSKSTAVREMEEQAKRIANEAVRNLRESIHAPDDKEGRFTPTWTGGEPESEARFGDRVNSSNRGKARPRPRGPVGVQGLGDHPKSSSSLLASLRQQNAAVQSSGGSVRRRSYTESDSGSSADTGKNGKYTKLMVHIRNYVKEKSPTTDELLDEFASVKSEDAAIFRRLLKSIANKGENGRWQLQEGYL